MPPIKEEYITIKIQKVKGVKKNHISTKVLESDFSDMAVKGISYVAISERSYGPK